MRLQRIVHSPLHTTMACNFNRAHVHVVQNLMCVYKMMSNYVAMSKCWIVLTVLVVSQKINTLSI